MLTFILIYLLCGAMVTVFYGYYSSGNKTDDAMFVESMTCFFMWWLVLMMMLPAPLRKLGKFLRNKRNTKRG